MESTLCNSCLNLLHPINWALYAVSVFLGYALGAIWYSPVLFGPRWAEIINPGYKKDVDRKMSYLPMYVQFAATAILALSVFVGVQVSFHLTILFLIALAGWQKAGLFFKFPRFQTFFVLALIELGYFALLAAILLIFAMI